MSVSRPINTQPISLPSAQSDAFGRLRSSLPITQLDLKQIGSENLDIIDKFVFGAGLSTYDPNTSSSLLSVAGAGDYAIRQSRSRAFYQAGKSLLCEITFSSLQPEAGVTKRVGYFNSGVVAPYNDLDGIYLEASGGELALVVSNNGVADRVSQANWNMDKLDGSGNSRVVLDPASSQILVIDLQWLGVGRVRIGFFIDGDLRYAHQFNHSNISGLTGVYTKSPNHSIRYEIRSSGGAGSLRQICAAVLMEGSGRVALGNIQSARRNTSTLSITSGIIRPLVVIRLQSGMKDTVVIPEIASFLSNTGANYSWFIARNPGLLVGGVPTDWEGVAGFVAASNSAIEYKNDFTINDTLDLSLGRIEALGFTSNNQDASANLLRDVPSLGCGITGDRDVLVAGVESFGNEQYRGSLTWREFL